MRDPDQALARAAASTQDWAGGTRPAESIRHFVDAHGRRGLARGHSYAALAEVAAAIRADRSDTHEDTKTS